MKAFRLMALASLLMLGGCSYIYDIAAVMIDGRLAFVVDQESGRKPSCVSTVSVVLDVRAVKHPDGVDPFLWKEGQLSDCANTFPIFYGQRIKGEAPSPDHVLDTLPAKPLKIGVIYEVHILSEGSGYGGGRFRLTADGRVENLPGISH
jgi:hypothetical protein